MNLKPWIIGTLPFITLVILIKYTSASAIGFKECQHFTNGVLDGTYAIVPANQQCPTVPANWASNTIGDGSKKHDPNDHSCSVSSAWVDL